MREGKMAEKVERKERKPELRFKGFDGEWEEEKFSSVFSYLQNNTFSRAELTSDTGFAKNVHYGDVLTKFGEVLDVENIDLPFTSNKDVVAKFSSSFLRDKDVVIADTAEDETVGKCCELKGVRDDIVLSGLHTIPCRPNQTFSSGYLGYYLNSPAYHSQLLPLMQGTKVTSISKNALGDTEILYPATSDEQGKISSVFSLLTLIITHHQHKYDQLQNLKKAMLEKMFPRDGADVPEIRFKGFEGAWDLKGFDVLTYPAGEKNRDNLPLESYSISNEKGFVPQDEQFENGGVMHDADKRMYYIVQPQSFAYNPARINVGSIGYSDLDKPVIVSSLYEVFKTTSEVDDRFLWYWFKSTSFQKKIEEFQEGGVRLYFYYDKLCMCSLPLPNIGEQKAIGTYFQNLDNLISHQQKKLEHLKHLKAALLDKMFVSDGATA